MSAVEHTPIRLEPLDVEHLEVVRRWRNENRMAFTDIREIDLADHLRWFASRRPSDRNYIVYADPHGPVGALAAIERPDGSPGRSIEIGRVMLGRKDLARRGIMKAAIAAVIEKHSDGRRVWLRVKKDNEPAIGLYRRCGFLVTSDDGPGGWIMDYAKGRFDALADEFGSDKGASGGHFYGQHYEAHAWPHMPPAPTVLEIGVSGGGSIRMWECLFPLGLIWGIDANPECWFTRDRVRIQIGYQADPDFLDSVTREAGGFDLVVDDGSHERKDTLASLAVLFPRTRGVYVIEDLWHEWRDEVVRAVESVGGCAVVESSKHPDRLIVFARRSSRPAGP